MASPAVSNSSRKEVVPRSSPSPENDKSYQKKLKASPRQKSNSRWTWLTRFLRNETKPPFVSIADICGNVERLPPAKSHYLPRKLIWKDADTYFLLLRRFTHSLMLNMATIHHVSRI